MSQIFTCMYVHIRTYVHTYIHTYSTQPPTAHLPTIHACFTPYSVKSNVLCIHHGKILYAILTSPKNGQVHTYVCTILRTHTVRSHALTIHCLPTYISSSTITSHHITPSCLGSQFVCPEEVYSVIENKKSPGLPSTSPPPKKPER